MPKKYVPKLHRNSSQFWFYRVRRPSVRTLELLYNLNKGTLYSTAFKVVKDEAIGVIWRFRENPMKQKELRDLIPKGAIKELELKDAAVMIEEINEYNKRH